MEVVAEILETEAILISNPHSEHKDLVELIKRRVEGYITAQKYVMISYNVTDDIMDKALTITPGKKSPNVTELADGAKAITCLINKKEVVKQLGKDQVKRWRRSYDEPPPPMNDHHEHHPRFDPRYRLVSNKLH